MYQDSLNRLADLGDNPPVDARREEDRERLTLALAQAKVATLRLKYANEFFPALRDAARAFLMFRMCAAKAQVVYSEFTGCGLDIPAPATLLADPADLPALVASLLQAGLLDPNDVIIADFPKG